MPNSCRLDGNERVPIRLAEAQITTASPAWPLGRVRADGRVELGGVAVSGGCRCREVTAASGCG